MSSDLLSLVLLAEVFVVGLVVLYLIFFVFGKKKQEQRQAVEAITRGFKKHHSERSKELNEDAILSSIDGELLSKFVQEISQKEANLYQQISKLFLQKDTTALKLLDKRVKEVSDSYWEVIKQTVQSSQNKVSTGGNEASLKADLDVAVSEQERLSEQLNVALTTLDEVSNEYAHLFGSDKDEEELKASKEKMLACFQKVLTDNGGVQ